MNIKAGDVVKLKSGSPLMTVKYTAAGTDGHTYVNVGYFDDDGNYRELDLIEETLEIYKPLTIRDCIR